MKPIICEDVTYRVQGHRKAPGCYNCIVPLTKKDCTRTTIYSLRTTHLEPHVCKICKTTNLNKALTGRNREKAEQMFQNEENTRKTIESITIVEKIKGEIIAEDNTNIDHNNAFEGIQEIIDEVTNKAEQNKELSSETGNREVEEFMNAISEEGEWKKTIEGKPEVQRDRETEQQETREADSSSAGAQGLEPIFYSDLEDEERIRILEEILKEGLLEEEINQVLPNVIPELDNIPPLLNHQAMQEALNTMEMDNGGEDTCERYVSGYIPPHNSLSVNCRLCLINEINIVFLPCRHASLCNICAATFTECPRCRSPIHERFDMHLL